MKKLWPLLILVVGILLGTYWTYPVIPFQPEIRIKNPEAGITPSSIEDVVDALLSSLDAEQLKAAEFSFDHEERYNFNYVPIARKGLPLKQLNPSQKELVMDVLRTAMSPDGIRRIQGIMELEGILRELEGHGPNSTYRDPQKYYFSVFGTPSVSGPWGWRFEGHHLSLNFTSINNKLVSATPSFMGANPAKVLQGARKDWRLLRQEEEMGRSLVTSLNESQMVKAVFSDIAPKEILTASERTAQITGEIGIRYSELNPTQQQLMMDLIDLYLGRMSPSIQAEHTQKLKVQGLDDILFAWAGTVEPGGGHYYRIQTLDFLLEYDNTQNGANHIHTVWRGFDSDFGDDLLQRHYDDQH